MGTMMTEDLLSSSEARDAILSRHEQLRGLVSETMLFAEGASRSDRELEPLRSHARERRCRRWSPSAFRARA